MLTCDGVNWFPFDCLRLCCVQSQISFKYWMTCLGARVAVCSYKNGLSLFPLMSAAQMSSYRAPSKLTLTPKLFPVTPQNHLSHFLWVICLITVLVKSPVTQDHWAASPPSDNCCLNSGTVNFLSPQAPFKCGCFLFRFRGLTGVTLDRLGHRGDGSLWSTGSWWWSTGV